MGENDRELLELAAKAVGFSSWDWLGGDGLMNVYDAEGRQSAWNPLTNDGDALRLAVKLNIQITPGTYNKDEFTAFKAAGGEAHEFRHFQQDEYAATRRAIVRAAAEIGKAMP